MFEKLIKINANLLWILKSCKLIVASPQFYSIQIFMKVYHHGWLSGKRDALSLVILKPAVENTLSDGAEVACTDK